MPVYFLFLRPTKLRSIVGYPSLIYEANKRNWLTLTFFLSPFSFFLLNTDASLPTNPSFATIVAHSRARLVLPLSP